jgi:predicted secreted protein
MSADIGWDASFGVEGATPGTYVAVAGVRSISPPGATRETVDVTTLKSPGKWREFIAGLKEGGDCSLGLVYSPSASDPLFTAFNSDGGNYQITFPNGVMLRFAGIPTEWAVGELTPEGEMTASATFKQTGPATLHAAAGG